jgi:hypothetical protein
MSAMHDKKRKRRAFGGLQTVSPVRRDADICTAEVVLTLSSVTALWLL